MIGPTTYLMGFAGLGVGILARSLAQVPPPSPLPPEAGWINVLANLGATGILIYVVYLLPKMADKLIEAHKVTTTTFERVQTMDREAFKERNQVIVDALRDLKTDMHDSSIMLKQEMHDVRVEVKSQTDVLATRITQLKDR